MSESYAEFKQLLKEKKFAEAVRLAERENMKDPRGNVFWLTQQAIALSRTGDNDQALKTARRAMAMEPSNVYAVLAAADALFGMQKHVDALALYLEAAANPDVSRRSRRGALECLVRLKKWEETLQRISEWTLGEEDAIQWRVKALAGLTRTGEAIEECRRWLQIKPDHPGALWELTELEVARDGLDAVLDRLGRMARIPSLPATYREIYASLCRRAGKPEAALREYEKLGAQGASSKIQRQEAFTMTGSGKQREALPLLEDLLREDPRDVYLHSSYESACRKIGDIERAINFYDELLRRHPEVKSLYGRIKNLKRALEKTQ